MVSMLDVKADAGVWSIGRPTTYLVAERFMTKNPANYYRYSNPEYDFAVNMAATSPTTTEEIRWWRQAQLILSEDLPGLFPVEVRSAQAVRNNIKGVIPTGSSYFDYQLIRIEP
jgi:ABC-type transport system substrate-binding protein